MAKVSSPLLDVLADEDRALLLAEGVPRHYRRGEVIFHADDPADSLHLIVAGRVLVRRTLPGGMRAIIAFLRPGEFFGELALITSDPPAPRNATVQAVSSTTTLVIGARRFADLRRRRPAVDRFLAEVLAARVARLDKQLVEALLMPAESRVVHSLLTLLDDEPGAAVEITQEDLAAVAGTSRATANRVLRSLERTGLVRLTRARIEVLDPEGLARRVQ
jgi:CRP-like cAMP-binding protein